MLARPASSKEELRRRWEAAIREARSLRQRYVELADDISNSSDERAGIAEDIHAFARQARERTLGKPER